MFLQIRKSFKRKIYPFFNDGASFKTSYGTYSSTASEKYKRNSKFDDSTGGNASLKKIKVNPPKRNSKLDDSAGDNASPRKSKVYPSSRNSKFDDSIGGNAWPKKSEVNTSNNNSKFDDNEDSNSPLKKFKRLIIDYYTKYFK